MPPRTRQVGQLIETSYFDNTGGLNTSDSPFKVLDTQATGGVNFEYTTEGAVTKRRGHDEINTAADTQLKSRGLDIFNTTLGTKTLIRAADRKVQNADLDALTFTNLTQDLTAATSDVFPASTSTPTVFSPFNTDTVSLLNFAGNTDGVYSVYSTSKYTKNGAVAPAGSISTDVSLTGGSFQTTGTFQYAVTYLKAATGAESNATLDVSAVVANTTDKVTLTLSTLTSVDTATYNRVNVYRSAVSGSSGFTTGDLVATLTLPVTSYVDTGTATTLTTNVPRADSLVLDNSVLPTGTYNTVTLWKRRLVTATGSVVRMSDLNVPESWPTVNTITVPSGGPITGLAVISFNTDFGNDEYLAVFKENELWLIRGEDYTDWTLSKVDDVGCPNQSLITFANGFLAWINFSGVYIWDGSGKPIYCSKPIESLFAIDGDLDKTRLAYGCARYSRTRNMAYWFVSSKTYGEQKLAVKMDLRLTLPGVSSNLSGRVIPGVFVQDESDVATYSACVYLPTGSAEELFVLGDDTGKLYDGYSVYADADAGINFEYYTPFLDLSSPNVSKRFNKVIVWVDEIGDWDLTLDYWAGYRAALSARSTLQAPISVTPANQAALWDVAYWDQSNWDDYTPRLRGLVFNLNNNDGNGEGDCIRLRLRNSGANEPITIHGYSVWWTEKAPAK
jgi:hypothetical protein